MIDDSTCPLYAWYGFPHLPNAPKAPKAYEICQDDRPDSPDLPDSPYPYVLCMLLGGVYAWSLLLRLAQWYVRRTYPNVSIKVAYDISKNMVHHVNAMVCVATMSPAFINNVTDIYANRIVCGGIIASFAFYLYDTACILWSLKQSLNIPYLVHHVVTMMWLWYAWNGFHREVILYVVYLLEYSNFLLYVSYHLRKVYPEYTALQMVSECFQLVWYGYFRVIRLSIFLFQVRTALFTQVFTSLLCSVMFVILYAMGLYWTCNLWKKCAKHVQRGGGASSS